MANQTVQAYVLTSEIEITDAHVQDLITTYNSTTAPNHSLTPFNFNVVRPIRALSSTGDIVTHHFEVRPPSALVQPIWVLDKQSLEDGSLKLVVPPDDEVEGSEAQSCRVSKEWVNAVTANLSIGHMDPLEYVNAARGGVFSGFD